MLYLDVYFCFSVLLYVGLLGFQEANARLKCVYFPIVEVRSAISCFGFVIMLVFLLLLLRVCALLLLTFFLNILKTDLAHHHPFTLALRSFGNILSGKESVIAAKILTYEIVEVTIEILKDGKHSSTLQLQKEYRDWVIQMHDRYDEEINCGEDEPVHIIGPQNKKQLGITADAACQIQAIDLATWNCQVEKHKGGLPSRIDILAGQQCNLLGISGELPIEAPVVAGFTPPRKIVAVIRPANFTSSMASKGLDQKNIVKNEFEMSLKISRKCGAKQNEQRTLAHTKSVKPSSHIGISGLYIFGLQDICSKLFHKAGIYIFTFFVVKNVDIKHLEAQVVVKPDTRVCKWRFVFDGRGPFIDKQLLSTR
ncbi:hypothetical protein BHM03_00011306 [Ensete ventricosum]|nr:hypothetical protein BHM03_00011306 [Ensete ventricosum]